MLGKKDVDLDLTEVLAKFLDFKTISRTKCHADVHCYLKQLDLVCNVVLKFVYSKHLQITLF